MKAVVIDGDRPLVKSNVPIPILDENCILIRTVAVAGNTSEFKHLDLKLGPQGSILGCDVVGEIVQLGSNIIEPKDDEYQIGDYVYAFVHGASHSRPYNGAFAEYVSVDSATTYKCPKGWTLAKSDYLPQGPVTTFEGAVSIPFSMTTAGAVLYHEMRLQLEWEPKEPQNNFPLLIWGGATGVGQSLIQIAKRLHGYTKIIVVCSKKHRDNMIKYGADDVFDYHDEDVVQQIKQKYPNIQHLIDAVSNDETIQQVYKCSADDVPVTLMQLVFLNLDNIKPEDRKDNVKIIGTVVYLSTGLGVQMGESYHFPANPIYRRDIINFVKFIEPHIAAGEIQHMPVKIFRNGLDDIPEITDLIRKGKTSGEKFVTVLQ